MKLRHRILFWIGMAAFRGLFEHVVVSSKDEDVVDGITFTRSEDLANKIMNLKYRRDL